MLMPDKPNILFLMTDHTNTQALAPGSQCLTPNLDSLAAVTTEDVQRVARKYLARSKGTVGWYVPQG